MNSSSVQEATLVQLLQTTTTLHPRTMIWPAKTAISGPEWSQLTVHSSGNVPDSGSIFPSVVFRDANHRDLEPTCCQPGCCSAAEEWLALDPRWSSRMGAPVRSGLASMRMLEILGAKREPLILRPKYPADRWQSAACRHGYGYGYGCG
jgi:hypothetical protein